MKEIIENNKVIAEFMGYKFNAYPKLKHHNITKPNESEWYFASWELSDFEEHIKERFNYHSYWSELMPVVEKIESMGYAVTIAVAFATDIWKPNHEPNISFREASGNTLTDTYKAVLQFITWYNTTTKK